MYLLVLPFIIFLIFIAFLSYGTVVYVQKIKQGRTVVVKDTAKNCIPSLENLPVIPVQFCTTETGSSVECYEQGGVNYQISLVPVYYRSVCIKLCGTISEQGNCEEENELYDNCIILLEPPMGCNNTANPLGRLDGTSDYYYAKTVLSR